MEELLRESDPSLAHYTVPPERALGGTPEEVLESIVNRITTATAVLVVNTPGLHTKPTAKFEMNTSVDFGKRIVVVQPPGQLDLAIPEALDGHVYRYAPWRSDVVGKAIRGEYPRDDRIFDLAEVADRREIVAILAMGVAACSFLVFADAISGLHALNRELAAAGVRMDWSWQDTGDVVGGFVLGSLVLGAIGLLSGDALIAGMAAIAGGLGGAAFATHSVYRAKLHGTRRLQVLSIRTH